MESTIHTIPAAGDPFPSRQECHCFAEFVTLAEGVGGEGVEFAVPCRRCNKGDGMIVSGVTREDLMAAAGIAGGVMGNPLHFARLDSYSEKKHVVRLRVRNLDAPEARLHLHSYLLGHSRNPRRSRHACGHAVGDFLVAVFESSQCKGTEHDDHLQGL